jgi:hypothetical protein
MLIGRMVLNTCGPGTSSASSTRTRPLADDECIVADPDPARRSGWNARVIGYSSAAAAVLVVILVHARTDRPGAWWGANGWRANSTERRTYWEQTEQKGSSDE